jgi:hypothetical protein
MYGGSSSDLLAFEQSTLYKKLKSGSFLAPGLCIFGDNAYIITTFMATPYPGTAVGQEKDDYNFFHSQLRIIIECAFGRLVVRFGFLQQKAPQHYTIQKIIATVLCLCKLHNFCTNKSLEHRGTLDPPERTEGDVELMRLNGGYLPLQTVYHQELECDTALPMDLMNAGNHNEGTTQHFRSVHEESMNLGHEKLPCEIICDLVAHQHLHRPPLRNCNCTRNTGAINNTSMI